MQPWRMHAQSHDKNMKTFAFTLLLLILQAVHPCAWGAAVALQAGPDSASFNLPGHVQAFEIATQQAQDADALWAMEAGKPVLPDAGGRWKLRTGQLLVAKLTLAAPSAQIYVIEVPNARVDLVQVYWRKNGKPWNRDQAGDMVALGQWRIAGQYPAFPLQIGEEPIDVMVVLANDGTLSVPVWLMSDVQHHELSVLQANLSGMMTGAARMIVLICIFVAFIYRRPSAWVLVAYGVLIAFSINSVNGTGALWFTPNLPFLNDISKHLFVVLMSAVFPLLVSSALDRSSLTVADKYVGRVMLGLGIVYATLQAFVLPHDWRLVGIAVWGVLVICSSLWLCVRSARQDGHYIGWVGLSVVLFVASSFAFVMNQGERIGLDFHNLEVAVLLLSSCLCIGQVLVRRERTGRDVLGRADMQDDRDPLTALLSYNGFQQSYDFHLLRQKATKGNGYVMYFSLLDMEQCKIDDGYVRWQRDLVEFAVILQRVLGQHWELARLSDNVFAGVCVSALRGPQIAPLSTQILAMCARKTNSHTWLERANLRIVLAQRDFAATDFLDLIREMDYGARLMPQSKRIAQI